ncbi:MAG: hypothetical protein AAGA48_26130 [Myxococcota bacterium]
MTLRVKHDDRPLRIAALHVGSNGVGSTVGRAFAARGHSAPALASPAPLQVEGEEK